MPTKQIVALGGGGFSDTNRVSPVDKYILKLAGKQYPKVAFVGTASGDSDSYIQKFYTAFSQTDCLLSHLNLFRSNHLDPESFLLEQDIIYVGGGNTFNLLAIWKSRGVDEILKKAWEKGIILCGISAGSLCWFAAGNTDSFGQMDKIDGLGFLPYSNSPHYNSNPTRRPNFHQLIQNKEIPEGYGVEEGVALHFEDHDLKHVITEIEGNSAYWIGVENGSITEKRLESSFVGNN